MTHNYIKGSKNGILELFRKFKDESTFMTFVTVILDKYIDYYSFSVSETQTKTKNPPDDFDDKVITIIHWLNTKQLNFFNKINIVKGSSKDVGQLMVPNKDGYGVSKITKQMLHLGMRLKKTESGNIILQIVAKLLETHKSRDTKQTESDSQLKPLSNMLFVQNIVHPRHLILIDGEYEPLFDKKTLQTLINAKELNLMEKIKTFQLNIRYARIKHKHKIREITQNEMKQLQDKTASLTSLSSESQNNNITFLRSVYNYFHTYIKKKWK
jgi:hypothetical protein